MYLKLALRNVRRSLPDYLLYISSMSVLISVMFISNFVADFGNRKAGFQTISLPLLIVLVMVVLINYINTFIVKQRAKEFATYLLHGMEKNKLTRMFLCELCVTGVICFLLGVLSGTGICFAFFYRLFPGGGILGIVIISTLQTLGYFCLVEVLSLFCIRQTMNKLQIIQLIHEKQRNQPLGAGRRSFWGRMLVSSFSCFFILLTGITFMSDEVISIAVSIIAIPMLMCIFSFYQWLYAFFASIRLSQTDALYQGNRLYRIAEITTGSKTGAGLHTIFCICLLFSATSFVFGTLLLHPGFYIFERTRQQWMGFLQIAICVIFLVIYFSILSLQQMIDLKKGAGNMQLLFYMGRNPSELKYLLRTQILVKLFLPTLMSFTVLGITTPFINYKVNSMLPAFLHNLLLYAVCCFIIFFFMLYLCYFCMLCFLSLRYIRFKIPSLFP